MWYAELIKSFYIVLLYIVLLFIMNLPILVKTEV